MKRWMVVLLIGVTYAAEVFVRWYHRKPRAHGVLV